MKTWYLRLIKSLGMMMLAAPLVLAAAQDSTMDESTVLQGLLSSIAREDYVGFTESGTSEFAALPREQFQSVVDQLGARLENGYRTERLGAIRRQGQDFSLWKVIFTDGGDDVLATLNIVGDKVGGFFLH